MHTLQQPSHTTTYLLYNNLDILRLYILCYYMQTETNMMANITNIIQLTQYIAKIKCLLRRSMYREKDGD